MDRVPLDSLLLLVAVDLTTVLTMSALVGGFVARGSDAPVWKGIAIGLFLPIVGPLVWAVAALAADHRRARVTRVVERSVVLISAAGSLLLASLLLLVATFLPWGYVSGGFQGYAVGAGTSAAETGAGLVASLMTAAAAVLAASAALVITAWRRIAFVVIAMGSTWLVLTIDGIIVLSAVNDFADTVDGLSAGQARLEGGVGLGLWLALVAAVLITASGVALGWLPRAVGDSPVRQGPSSTGLAAPVGGSVEQPGPVDSGWGEADWGAAEGRPGPVGGTAHTEWGAPSAPRSRGEW